MRLGIVGANDVDLRERTERALACDAHLVAALHALRHLAFHREPGLERVLELPLRGGVAHALAREHDAATGRDHHRLDAIAHRHVDVAVGVFQLRDVDLGFALAADIDEGHLRPNRDHGALDGLATTKLPRLDRRLEHRREIFFLIAHCILLKPVPLLIMRDLFVRQVVLLSGDSGWSSGRVGCTRFPLPKRRPPGLRIAPEGVRREESITTKSASKCFSARCHRNNPVCVAIDPFARAERTDRPCPDADRSGRAGRHRVGTGEYLTCPSSDDPEDIAFRYVRRSW